MAVPKRPTSEQLVEELGNKLEITICSDIVHSLDFEYKQVYWENQELKNELSYLVREYIEVSNKFSDLGIDFRKKEKQKAIFIEYLEDEIKRLREEDIYQPLQRAFLATLEHVLSKYKEIIGVKDETPGNNRCRFNW